MGNLMAKNNNTIGTETSSPCLSIVAGLDSILFRDTVTQPRHEPSRFDTMMVFI